MKMQKFDLAEDDLLKVLQFEPKNMESKKELEILRTKLTQTTEKVTNFSFQMS